MKSSYSFQMRENTDQKNSEYEPFAAQYKRQIARILAYFTQWYIRYVEITKSPFETSLAISGLKNLFKKISKIILVK